jgi:threonine dehydrogenase-like Zn-dependent dehydrogenase
MPLSYETCARGEYHLLFPHDHQASDVSMALDLMARRRLAVDDLITLVLAPAEAAMGYARLQRREALLVAFDWRR